MSEGDDKMSDKIITTDIYTELERYMDYITQQLKDNLQDVIDNAIDAQLYIDLSTKEPVGFDISILIGGPNIRLVYSRGVCQLRGSWRSITDEKDIDNEICETILDYLADYLNYRR